MKTNQTKLNLELASLESTDAELVISQLETKECNTELQAEKTKTQHCKSDKETCETNLADKNQENKNLQVQNSNLMKLSEELETNKLKIVSDLKYCNEELITIKEKCLQCHSDLRNCKFPDSNRVISNMDGKRHDNNRSIFSQAQANRQECIAEKTMKTWRKAYQG